MLKRNSIVYLRYLVLRRKIRPCASMVFQQKLQPNAGPGRMTGQCCERASIDISRVMSCMQMIKTIIKNVKWNLLCVQHTSGVEIDRCNSSYLFRIECDVVDADVIGVWSIDIVIVSGTIIDVEIESCAFVSNTGGRDTLSILSSSKVL